jgi:peroxiredoxin
MQKIVAGCLIALCASCSFERPNYADSPASSAAAKSGGKVDKGQPKPEDVLRKMCDYLGNLPAFSCRIHTTIQLKARGVDNSTQTNMDVRLERPNRLAVLVEGDILGMSVVSDGKKLTRYMPMLNRYTVTDAPADLAGLAEAAAAGGSMMGLSGLLVPTTGDEFYEKIMDGVTESEYVGSEEVGGVRCHRCKFVQDEFMWEIWVDESDRPLVRKFTPDISKQFGEAAGTLQNDTVKYVVAFTDWDVAPKFSDADFQFEPPADAEKVDSIFGGEQEDEEPHPMLGQAAPPFETVDMEGEPIDLAKHIGQKVILLDFWATWCSPCIKALPQVNAVAQKFADRGLVFYAVNGGEDVDTIKEFLKSNELDVPVAMDVDLRINGLYGVDELPQTILIGKDGKVQVVHVGYNELLADELMQNIEDLLDGKDLAGPAETD